MVLGIDIDDTITKTTENATKILNKDVKYKDVVDYHDIEEEEFYKFVNNNIRDILGNVELKEDVRDVLKRLKDKGNKIIFVTARGSLAKEVCGISCAFLDRWNIPYDKVVYFKDSKVDTVLREGIELFIDDKEEVLDEISKEGVLALQMGRTVKSWKEIENILDSMEVKNG